MQYSGYLKVQACTTRLQGLMIIVQIGIGVKIKLWLFFAISHDVVAIGHGISQLMHTMLHQLLPYLLT